MNNADIVSVFNKFRNDPQMHTDVYSGGCIQRTGKILEDIPDACYVIFMGENGQDICCSDTKTKWKQHYVPIVFDETRTPVVLDVCLMDGPETLDNYMKHFENLVLFVGPDSELRLQDLNTYEPVSAQNILDEISVSARDRITPNSVRSKWLENFCSFPAKVCAFKKMMEKQ